MLKQRPSSRVKRRYLLVRSGKEKIERAILDYIGILGWARAAPVFVKKFDKRKDGTQIVAVSRKEINNIRAAFALSADDIEILGVSGTLKGLKKTKIKDERTKP